MKSLGIDIGSSSAKAALLDTESGKCLCSASSPDTEMPITALAPGWAEQNPELWWKHVCESILKIKEQYSLADVRSIGITYQMHGLVCLDKNGSPVRDAIIWCDSRAVDIGRDAMERLGRERCLSHLLNSPGNFTASKLAWVIRNEKENFLKTASFFLPGDYIAYRLSGDIHTTETGLSEQILWDFREGRRADFVADFYGIPHELIPDTVPSVGIQTVTDAAAQILFGIPAGTPISYRAGDQPNNAFSLNVLDPGEIAATAGTSGVVYGVTDIPEADPLSRVNTFVHVGHTARHPRYGILLCINGAGIMNAWVRRHFAPGMDYDSLNSLAATAPAGSDGICVVPFGNGAERMLGNIRTGASVSGLDLNRHGLAHILRATQEGIACSFRYGIEIMKGMGLKPDIIRAGKANLFLSPLFRQTLATITGARIELYDTDGALGAARGAALGAGLYKSREETFASLAKTEEVTPREEEREMLEECYRNWKNHATNI